MSMDLSGRTLGEFALLSLLGQGGMGSVYRAREAGVERLVAVKVLEPDLTQVDSQFASRFLREAQLLGRLTHRFILPLYRFGESDGLSYLVMPLLTGGSLAARLRAAGSLAVAEAAQVLAPLAAALDYAHRQGILHRDLKPSNILFDDEGQPLLADFGIAVALDSAHTLTGTGVSIGTPHYMSPEQARGDRLDTRSDLYSLGVVAYEMLTGALPFEADTPLGVGLKHLTEAPRQPRQLRPDLPEACERALLQALAKTPAERFETAATFVVALTATGNEPGDGGRQPVTLEASVTSVPTPPEPSGRSLQPAKCGRCGAAFETVNVAANCPVCGASRWRLRPSP
jgi:serine/threonine-protein kinase